MKSTLFTAGHPTDTIVVSYYPLSGNDANTGPRYEAEAAATGYDILGITRVGSDTYSPSIRMRRALSPEHFEETCARDVDDLQAITRRYDYVVMRGQSTGSYPTLALVKSGAIRVTHLLIEDGINTRIAPSRLSGGPIASRMNWLRYGKRERQEMPRPPQESWIAPQVASSALRAAAKFAVEQFHWAPLWRSWYSVSTLIDIATSRSDLPILVKFLGYTGTSTEPEVQNLRKKLAGLDQLRVDSGQHVARIRSDFDPDGWHGFLVYPQYGAKNLQEARSMESLVTSPRR